LCAEGQFCVEGNQVLLYDMQGMYQARQEIPPTFTARETAARLLKRRESMRRSDFNRRIVYDKFYY
jgi:hypothetical protein